MDDKLQYWCFDQSRMALLFNHFNIKDKAKAIYKKYEEKFNQKATEWALNADQIKKSKLKTSKQLMNCMKGSSKEARYGNLEIIADIYEVQITFFGLSPSKKLLVNDEDDLTSDEDDIKNDEADTVVDLPTPDFDSLSEFQKNPQLNEILKAVLKVCDRFRDSHHQTVHVLKEVLKLIEGCRQSLPKPIELYSYGDDWRRKGKLKKTLDDSKTTFYAFTYAEGNYLSQFFTEMYVKEYNEAQKAAIGRAVDVQRIFGINPNTLDQTIKGKDRTVRQMLLDIVREQDDLGVKVKVVNLVESGLTTLNTSFVVCDNDVISESYSIPDGGKTNGYWGFDEEKRNFLNEIWEHLYHMNDITEQLMGAAATQSEGV